MASSTRRPIASTIANIDNVLMVNPQIYKTANVPNNTTGTVIVGISVERRFCKKTYITITTKMIASIKVCTTLLIDNLTNGVVS